MGVDISIDLYHRCGVSVHHSNTFYESRSKTVATQDGQEVCVRDPIKGLFEVQKYSTLWAPSRLRVGNGILYCGHGVEDRVSGTPPYWLGWSSSARMGRTRAAISLANNL